MERYWNWNRSTKCLRDGGLLVLRVDGLLVLTLGDEVDRLLEFAERLDELLEFVHPSPQQSPVTNQHSSQAFS